MVIDAITTAATQAAKQFVTLPSCYQSALLRSAKASGIPFAPSSSDSLLQLLSQSFANPAAITDLPYVNALANLTVCLHSILSTTCQVPVHAGADSPYNGETEHVSSCEVRTYMFIGLVEALCVHLCGRQTCHMSWHCWAVGLPLAVWYMLLQASMPVQAACKQILH